MPACPDSGRHNPHPIILRAVVAQSGYSIAAAAAMIGIPARTLQNYLSDKVLVTRAFAPYPVQFALEQLAAGRDKERAMAARSAALRADEKIGQM